MKKMKKLMCLALAAALALGMLAGCTPKIAGIMDGYVGNDVGNNVGNDTGNNAGNDTESVSDTILWMNGTSAVLTELNGWDYTIFGGMEPSATNQAILQSLLDSWWGVTDRDSAIENMDWLLTEGHRVDFAELMGMFDEDELYEFSEEELAAFLGEIFEDEEEGTYLARSYQDYLIYGEHSIDGWDYCRAMSLLGWYYIAGYYTKSEALDQSLEVAQLMQQQFGSWDEMMESYLRGYEYWSYEDGSARRALYEAIKTRANSPYRLDWNLTLERSWPEAENGIPTYTGMPAQETAFEKSFGSYTVPAGWVESELYSTSDKFFYVQSYQEDAAQPDNISVEAGTNQYTLEEHDQFRGAIMAQLAMQIQGDEGATLTGDGTFTAQGDILYIFTIEGTDGVITKQYYIVGDNRYCLVHLTNFTGSQEADDAAQDIVDSFQWAP